MNIKTLAARLAVENGITTKTAERLLRAEAKLLQEKNPQLKRTSIEEIAVRRYTQDPGISNIASTPANLLVYMIDMDTSATPSQISAVKEYKQAINAMKIENGIAGIVEEQTPEGYVSITFEGSIYKEK